MRKPSSFVLVAAVVARRSRAVRRVVRSASRASNRAPLSPPDPHPPYLAISWENQSGESISRVLFEVHSPNGLDGFMSYRETQADVIDTSDWSDAVFVAAYAIVSHPVF